MGYNQYIAIAHNLDTDECEWSIYSGTQAQETAEHFAKKWSNRDGRWVAFVRPVGNIVWES